MGYRFRSLCKRFYNVFSGFYSETRRVTLKKGFYFRGGIGQLSSSLQLNLGAVRAFWSTAVAKASDKVLSTNPGFVPGSIGREPLPFTSDQNNVIMRVSNSNISSPKILFIGKVHLQKKNLTTH